MTDEREPEPRIECGPVAFGSDWPGLFIRGDQALAYALHLSQLLDILDEDEANVISVHVVRGLLHDLKSVNVHASKVKPTQLKTARECIISHPTLPGPSPELNPWTDESWIGDDKP